MSLAFCGFLKDAIEFIKNQKKHVRFFADKFPKYLDDKQKEEKRYKVFYVGRKERIAAFNKEVESIKLQRNSFYAMLHRLKHFWKV